jgi:hypothetical protein
VNDGGFDFRATDQQREFIWSQTVWVETTPVTGAVNLTHPNVVTKVGTAGQIVEGGITDESAANSDRLHVTAAGNVGIGTGSPTFLLSLGSSLVAKKLALFDNGSVFYGLGIESGLLDITAGPGGGIALRVNDTTLAMQIGAGGNILMYLGGSLKTLSVDASGFVKAT